MPSFLFLSTWYTVPFVYLFTHTCMHYMRARPWIWGPLCIFFWDWVTLFPILRSWTFLQIWWFCFSSQMNNIPVYIWTRFSFLLMNNCVCPTFFLLTNTAPINRHCIYFSGRVLCFLNWTKKLQSSILQVLLLILVLELNLGQCTCWKCPPPLSSAATTTRLSGLLLRFK